MYASNVHISEATKHKAQPSQKDKTHNKTHNQSEPQNPSANHTAAAASPETTKEEAISQQTSNEQSAEAEEATKANIESKEEKKSFKNKFKQSLKKASLIARSRKKEASLPESGKNAGPDIESESGLSQVQHKSSASAAAEEENDDTLQASALELSALDQNAHRAPPNENHNTQGQGEAPRTPPPPYRETPAFEVQIHNSADYEPPPPYSPERKIPVAQSSRTDSTTLKIESSDGNVEKSEGQVTKALERSEESDVLRGIREEPEVGNTPSETGCYVIEVCIPDAPDDSVPQPPRNFSPDDSSVPLDRSTSPHNPPSFTTTDWKQNINETGYSTDDSSDDEIHGLDIPRIPCRRPSVHFLSSSDSDSEPEPEIPVKTHEDLQNTSKNMAMDPLVTLQVVQVKPANQKPFPIQSSTNSTFYPAVSSREGFRRGVEGKNLPVEGKKSSHKIGQVSSLVKKSNSPAFLPPDRVAKPEGNRVQGCMENALLFSNKDSLPQPVLEISRNVVLKHTEEPESSQSSTLSTPVLSGVKSPTSGSYVVQCRDKADTLKKSGERHDSSDSSDDEIHGLDIPRIPCRRPSEHFFSSSDSEPDVPEGNIA